MINPILESLCDTLDYVLKQLLYGAQHGGMSERECIMVYRKTLKQWEELANANNKEAGAKAET